MVKKQLKTSDINTTLRNSINFGEGGGYRFGVQHQDDLKFNEEFVVLSNEGSRQNGPPLKTDFYTLILCLEGTCDKTIGPFNVQLKPRTIHLVSPRHITSYRHREDALKLYIILFKPEFLSRSFIKTAILSQLLDTNPEFAPLYELDENDFKEAKTLFEKIDVEYKQGRVYNLQIIRLLTLQLLYGLNRVSNHFRLSTSAPLSRQFTVVSNFRKLVDEHFMTRRSVQEYAELMNLSPKYLLQLVKSETGQTALSVIHSRIYLEAEYLLGLSTYNVKEVAEELGFDTSSHFSRFFKQYSGKTPFEYQLSQ